MTYLTMVWHRQYLHHQALVHSICRTHQHHTLNHACPCFLFWNNCDTIFVLYHGTFSIYWRLFTSMSNFSCMLFSMIHDNPTCWNTIWIKKVMIKLFNSSFCNFYVTVMSQFLHLILIPSAWNFLSHQILIKNIWKNLNNDCRILLSTFEWKSVCSKIPWKWNHIISSRTSFGQYSSFVILSYSIFSEDE